MVSYSNFGLLDRQPPKVQEVRYMFEGNGYNLISTLETIAELEGDIQVYDLHKGEFVIIKADHE